MSAYKYPLPHPDPELDVLRPYAVRSVTALEATGLRVDASWLDPKAPRDFTIRLDDGRALVWSEDLGWRLGGFAAGAPGVRTRLDGPVRLGGGVLPSADMVAYLAGGGRRVQEPVPPRALDARDGLDDQLRRF